MLQLRQGYCPALVKIANTLGYRTVVVDPRSAFGSEARFDKVNELIHAWPDEALEKIGINRSTAIAVLTHDPKLDDPALIKEMVNVQNPLVRKVLVAELLRSRHASTIIKDKQTMMETLGLVA